MSRSADSCVIRADPYMIGRDRTVEGVSDEKNDGVDIRDLFVVTLVGTVGVDGSGVS